MIRTAAIPAETIDAAPATAERRLPQARRTSDHDVPYRRALMEIILERRARAQELALARRERLQELAIKRLLVSFACTTFGTVILVTLCFLCCEGFHLWGFHFPEALMHWLGGAAIGSLASLMTIVYKRLL